MILPDRLNQKVLHIGVGKGEVQSNFNTIRSDFLMAQLVRRCSSSYGVIDKVDLLLRWRQIEPLPC